MPKLSILDLVRYGDDRLIGQALDNARDLAVHAEAWGFDRFWVAEHHNIPGIGSSATALVIGHIAAATRTIRVGSGGVMLPNHAPYVVAEQFGTLARMFPGRIDLGLGRAPGTDQFTIRALHRSPNSSNNFPQDVQELQAYFAPVQPNQRLQAIPAAGMEVPLWILGSSTFGAQLAAQLGLPYGFASHFAPDQLLPAIEIYRRGFRPSAQRDRPWVMAGVNVIVADTDAEAQRIASSQRMAFADLFRSGRMLMQPPIDDIDQYWTPAEKAQAHRMLARSAIGSPDTVRDYLRAFVAETGADELMVVSDIYDHSARLRSFELLASVAGIDPGAGAR